MKVDCYPISLLPRQSRLFLDYASSHEPLTPFFTSTPWSTAWSQSVPALDPAHRNTLADLLLDQTRSWFSAPGPSEPGPSTSGLSAPGQPGSAPSSSDPTPGPAKTIANIERLRQGAGAVLTGQQVALFTGPLYTLLKAATILRRAQDTGSVPVFWLASEDHDLAEADHVTLPARHALYTLRLQRDDAPDSGSPGAEPVARPVGNLPLGPGIIPLLDRAAELIGGTPEFDLLAACYTPGATFTSAFARFLARTFADQGLIVVDASTRAFHALGAPVLRHAIAHADELEAALHARDRLLAERGYHSQVLVAPGSSLLFLIDEDDGEQPHAPAPGTPTGDHPNAPTSGTPGTPTGARLPLRRKNGMWFTTSGSARTPYSTADLLALCDAAPERLSPNALLRPVFQDYLFPTQAIIGGPAEIAYYAQNQVLYQAILGRTTPVLPRLSATLIEPSIAKILDHDQLTLEDILTTHPDELAQRLGARGLPIEGKRRLSAAGNALDDELGALLAWTEALSPDLGRAAQVSASKMRYQMNRLRRLAASYQLQRDQSIRRRVDTLTFNLFPDRHPQERAIGGIAWLARYGAPLLTALIEHASQDCPGHKAIWL